MVLIFGGLIVNIVGSYLDIHTAALIFASLPVLFLLMFAQMPESPYYLIMKSKVVEAEKSLQWLRRKNDVAVELKTLTQDVNRQMSERGRYKDLFAIESNRVACVIMFSLRIIQQLSGVSAFYVYMQTMFEKTTSFVPKHIATILIIILSLCISFAPTLIVDKVGRKPLLVTSCIGTCLVLFAEAVYFTLQDFTSIDVSHLDYLPLIGVVIFFITFTIGQGSIVNLMLGEMFSSSIKAKASCLMNIVFAVTMTVSTKFYQYTSDYVGLCVPFFVFGFCQLVGAIFCVVYVPETRGKTLEEIQQELKGRCKDNAQ